MSGIVERSMEDPKVGGSDRDRLTISINKTLCAIVPAWESKKSLEPTPELLEKAKSGDGQAVEAVRKMYMRRKLRQEGTQEYPKPTVREFRYKDEEGFLYIPTYSMKSHYIDDEGTFICKTDQFRAAGIIKPHEQAPCCVKHEKEGATRTVVYCLVYETDVKGKPVELEDFLQYSLPSGKRIPFNYEYRTYGMNGKKIFDWKAAQSAQPPIGSDYLIFKKGTDQFAETSFNATGECLYAALGDEMIERILDETMNIRISKIETEFGRDLTYEEMLERWDNRPAAVGSGNRPATRADARRFIG